MGTCQLTNCRCVCEQSRIACQCGSQNTLMLEEQAREIRKRISQDSMRRSNRFLQNKQKSSNSPAKSNSSETQNRTKLSTHRKGTNRSPNSTEKYLISEECNIPTENSQQKKMRKHKIRNLQFNKGQTYFDRDSHLFQLVKEKDDENLDKVDNSKLESPSFPKNILENKNTLEQAQSVKELTMKTPTTGGDRSLQAQTSQPILNNQVSISRESSPSKLSHPVTLVSMEPNMNKNSLSVITDQQLKNRSHTAELSDDQKSVNPKSALKKSINNNDSFTTQQPEKKNKGRVRFDLPHSHYVKERARQQQRFFA